MQASDYLTDKVIERIASRFANLVPEDLSGTRLHDAARLRRILIDVLHDERRPVHKFVVEIRDDSREDAEAWLQGRLAMREGVRVT